MPTPVGTAPLTVDNRARCSTCSRLQFSTVCSRKQCSKCCRDDSRRCGYTGHDSYKAHLLHAAAAPAPIAQDSFALSRPPPIHPPALPFADTSNVPQPPVSALLSSEPTEPWEAATLARRSFRRPMDDSLKADWDQARALRDEKLRGIAMQRGSKWKKENSLTLWCWLKVSTRLVHDSPGTSLTYHICRMKSLRCASKYKAFIRSHSTASCKPRLSWSVLVCRRGAGSRRTWYDTGHGRNRIRTKCFPSSPSRYGWAHISGVSACLQPLDVTLPLCRRHGLPLHRRAHRRGGGGQGNHRTAAVGRAATGTSHHRSPQTTAYAQAQAR